MGVLKILCVFGTRPEAAKMTPVVLALKKCGSVACEVCVTAQHRELLDGVLAPFGITPEYDLGIMREGQTLGEITSRALLGVEGVIKKTAPDWVLVHGDTTTTFAASLAAFYNRARVGHVEAGLRTYDKYRPYPEEMNRRLTTALADMFFAPTTLARDNLLREGVPANAVHVTGNTAIDFLRYTVKEGYAFENPALAGIDVTKRIILMTAHRRESWGARLENVMRAARRVAEDYGDVHIVYPVHPNPVVRASAERVLAGCARVTLTEPLGVFDMHNLLNRSYIVLTDSGGLQEEAPALNKPVVVAREVTERPEGEEAGTLILAGTDFDNVYRSVSGLLDDPARYREMALAPNPFGDGYAANRILKAILIARDSK
jgi:UDP-N-acetylglucosamine 2-epimerase